MILANLGNIHNSTIDFNLRNSQCSANNEKQPSELFQREVNPFDVF